MRETDAQSTNEVAASGALLRLGLGMAVATLIIDQLHKWWMIAVYGIELQERVTVAPFLDLVYVINKGVSYGMFTQGSQTGQFALAAFAFIVALALTVWLAKGTHTSSSAIGIGLIAGGAVANAIDRLHLGGVADFFQLHAFGFYWYVFNIADVAIVAGVVALLYDSFILSRKDAAKQS
ncbi:MAG: signal peptidase II [Hyphomicrobiaceae bacterium]